MLTSVSLSRCIYPPRGGGWAGRGHDGYPSNLATSEEARSFCRTLRGRPEEGCNSPCLSHSCPQDWSCISSQDQCPAPPPTHTATRGGQESAPQRKVGVLHITRVREQSIQIHPARGNKMFHQDIKRVRAWSSKASPLHAPWVYDFSERCMRVSAATVLSFKLLVVTLLVAFYLFIGHCM